MAKKLRVGILFGGRSGEHEVSLLSANSILKAIDRKKFDVVPIGIDKQGNWLSGAQADRLLSSNPLAQSAVTLVALLNNTVVILDRFVCDVVLILYVITPA